EQGEEVTIFVSEGPRQVEVPDVTDLPLGEARDLIRQAGLKVGEITAEESDLIDEGNVIRQSPPSGFEADAGSRVDLVISSGPEAVIVPDVINQPQDSAENEIHAAGLEVEVRFAPDDEVDEGLVVSQDPPPGSEAEPGDIVVIVVSEGPEEREMPDVRGEDGDDAEAFLESDFGLNVTQEEAACPGAFPPGVVCDQSPEPGTPVSPGDDAVLFVQAGEASGFGAGIALALLVWAAYA
ncbi:MAG: PASTA domain-containing protein, partial [Actinomycetota bacterium]|nr:PASTA domain-containing protein [Actinomycetota bacterium]